jgi:hypothetical protein
LLRNVGCNGHFKSEVSPVPDLNHLRVSPISQGYSREYTVFQIRKVILKSTNVILDSDPITRNIESEKRILTTGPNLRLPIQRWDFLSEHLKIFF